jgi:hypothetical protein
MRELHGVMACHLVNDRRELKQRALLFDAIHVAQLQANINELDRVLSIHGVASSTNWPEQRAEIDYLISSGFLIDAEIEHIQMFDDPLPEPTSPDSPDYEVRRQSAFAVRTIACDLETVGRQAVPIFDSVDAFHFSGRKATKAADVMSVALDAFPTPSDDACAWQDILDFRADVRDKEWEFRRFLMTLATKQQTEGEIRDAIRYCVHQYAQAMRLRRMKIINSALMATVLPTLDVIAKLQDHHLGAIVGAGFALNKLRIELMEAEIKAPGRECAYVFDARQRFGRTLSTHDEC